MSKKKLLIVALLLALIAAFFAFDLGRFLSLDYIKSRQAEFAALYAAAGRCWWSARSSPIYVAVTRAVAARARRS